MHELALSQSIVELVVECARREGVHAVSRVVVQIGVGAGVAPEALRFSFDVVAAGTIAEGAELAIETVPLRAYCQRCQEAFEWPRFMTHCPRCGEPAAEILTGRELRVQSFYGE